MMRNITIETSKPKAMSAGKVRRWLPVFFLLAQYSFAQAASPQTGTPAASADLEQVLSQMDATAAKFRTTQASFTWIQYNKVIDDIADTQKGKIFFRRAGRDIQMAADFSEPDTKQLIFSEGKIQIYQPRIEQEDIYDAKTHREEFETFLVVGFGGGGHDMLKSFAVTFQGNEKIGDTETAKLDLVPKSEEMKRNFSHLTLWIDPQRGISVQQQLFETSGDYRLAKYSDIEVNQKISDNAFKLRTSSKTKVVSH
jgi:outer membrane lipoprotein-sorting protein